MANFFMNARRRSLDKYRDDSASAGGGSEALGRMVDDDGLMGDEEDSASLMAADNM